MEFHPEIATVYLFLMSKLRLDLKEKEKIRAITVQLHSGESIAKKDTQKISLSYPQKKWITFLS